MVRGTTVLEWRTTCATCNATVCSNAHNRLSPSMEDVQRQLFSMGWQEIDGLIYCPECVSKGKECPVCGRRMEKSDKRKYCSRDCSRIAQRIKSGKVVVADD